MKTQRPLCQASGWCQSDQTAWSSETGKWLCRRCEVELQQAYDNRATGAAAPPAMRAE